MLKCAHIYGPERSSCIGKYPVCAGARPARAAAPPPLARPSRLPLCWQKVSLQKIFGAMQSCRKQEFREASSTGWEIKTALEFRRTLKKADTCTLTHSHSPAHSSHATTKL